MSPRNTGASEKYIDCCKRISSHVCSDMGLSCTLFRQEFPDMQNTAMSVVDRNFVNDVDINELLSTFTYSWNSLVDNVNAKGISGECEYLSRCFLCWMFVPFVQRNVLNGDLFVQTLENAMKSAKMSLNQDNIPLVQNFEQLLSLYCKQFGANCQEFAFQVAPSASCKLSILLVLGLLNGKIGRVDNADKYLLEAESIMNNFPKGSFDILDAYYSLIRVFYRKNPPELKLAVRYAEKYLRFIEKHNIPSKRKMKLTIFLAGMAAKNKEYEKALSLLLDADSKESFEIVMARFRILLHHAAAGQSSVQWSDQFAEAIQEIVHNKEFRLDVGMAIVKSLFTDKFDIVADHMLDIIWRSIEKYANSAADVYPVFLYRLRRCLSNGNVEETKQMFLIFDMPTLLSQMPQKMVAQICSLLNTYAILFVKSMKFDNALSYYELCDNLLSAVPLTPENENNVKPDQRELVPFVAQIKRSLALCYFEVGRIEECEQTLRDAESFGQYLWIYFLRFYIAVKSAVDDAVAIDYLDKILRSTSVEASYLLDLSATVALNANKKMLAMTAMQYRVCDFFDKNRSSETSGSLTSVMNALKTLIRLRLAALSVRQDADHEESFYGEEVVSFADYMCKAYRVLVDKLASEKSSTELVEDIKWFSEVCWHISNKTNGWMVHSEELYGAGLWTPAQTAHTASTRHLPSKLALFTLYHCCAKFGNLLLEAYGMFNIAVNGDNVKLVLHKRCLQLSLCLACGLQYMRLLEIADPLRSRFADDMLDVLKECHEAVQYIASYGKTDAGVSGSLACGSVSMVHALPVFEFEIYLSMDRVNDAVMVLQKFVDESVVNASQTSTAHDEIWKTFDMFERFSRTAHEYAVVRGNLNLDCSGYFELCLTSLSLILPRLIGSAIADVDNHEKAVSPTYQITSVSSIVRRIFQSCKKYARDKFFSATSDLFKLMNQLVSPEWCGALWCRLPPNEANWLISACWNAGLDRQVLSLNADAKAWFTLAITGAERREDDKMLSLLRSRLSSLKKWEGLQPADCFDAHLL